MRNTTFSPIINIACLFILLGAMSRLIPHPGNLTALTAIGLFSGYYLKNITQAACILFGALLFSDLLIGFHALVPIIYLAFLIPLFFGKFLQNSKSKIIFGLSAGLISGLSFFIITNFAVWLTGYLYPKTFEGLLLCYTAGIPFLKNQICGDIVYTSLLFSVYELFKMKFTSSRITSE